MDSHIRKKAASPAHLSGGGERNQGLHPTLRSKFSITKALDILAQDAMIPRGLLKSVTGAIRARDSAHLKMIVDDLGSPQMYNDPDTYFRYQAFLSLFKKCGDLTSKNAEEVAVSKFMTAEENCYRVNRKFSLLDFDSSTLQVLERAATWIDKVLGPLDLHEVRDSARHGPGTSLGDGDYTTEWFKWWNGPYTASSGAVKFARELDSENPLFLRSWQVVNYNRVTFVPKTIFTKRSIAVEPKLSMYYQLGLGDAMARKLVPHGINIRNQFQNLDLARRASVTNEFATIDLSAASDSISIGLVEHLFGIRYGGHAHEWLKAMQLLRSPCYLHDGVTKLYGKFSSMGNGFTFPLETLIFASIVEAVRDLLNHPSPYSVYGDDILVHTDIAPFVIAVLADVGFATNTEKTFLTGPFRESCGGDFWQGRSVRPFILKAFARDVRDFYAQHNVMYNIASDVYTNLMDYVVSCSHPDYRFYGPSVPLNDDAPATHFFSEDWCGRVRRNFSGGSSPLTKGSDYQALFYRGLKTSAVDMRERLDTDGEELLLTMSLDKRPKDAPIELNARDITRFSAGWFRYNPPVRDDLEPRFSLTNDNVRVWSLFNRAF